MMPTRRPLTMRSLATNSRSRRAGTQYGLLQYDGSAAVTKYAPLRVPLDGAIENHRLELAADDGDVFGRLGVVDARDLLLDDRSFIQIGRHVMRRGADQLHSPGVRLVVGLGALEAGQEGMMNVDGTAFEVPARLGGEHLHVAGEHQDLGFDPLEELHEPQLLLLLAAVDDREVVIGYAMPLGEAAHVLMIGHYGHRLDGHRAGAPAVQDAVEAMPLARDRDQRAAAAHFIELPLHLESAADGLGELAIELFHGRHSLSVVVEHRAHERRAAVRVVVMLRFRDRRVVRGQEARDAGNDSRRVRASSGEDVEARGAGRALRCTGGCCRSLLLADRGGRQFFETCGHVCSLQRAAMSRSWPFTDGNAGPPARSVDLRHRHARARQGGGWTYPGKWMPQFD